MIQRPENIVKIESGEPSEPYDAFNEVEINGGISPISDESLNLEEAIKGHFEFAVEKALKAGYVVTIELVPQKPLAMGNYKPVVSVRSVRK